MEKIDNTELLKQLQEAHKKDDRSEVERIELLLLGQLQERKTKIEESFDQVKRDEEAATEVEQKVGTSSVRKANGDRRRRYKQLIELYRDSMKLAKAISVFKRTMRGGEEDEDSY
jgi:hypothetical protein